MDALERAGESDLEESRRLFDWLLADGIREQVVGGTAANFRVETDRERRRVRTLMYETDVLERVLATVSADDVFYDVGANVGVYTCFAGQRAERVVAFEPHERTAERLRENVALNGVDADVYECAVADYAGTASLSIPRRSSRELGTGEFSIAPVADATDAGDAEVVPGDRFVDRRDLPRPTVAKVDVEGAELRVLSGLSKTLASCRAVFVEVHRDHVTVDEVASRLTDAGFALDRLKDRGNTTFLRATDAGSGE